MPWPLNHGAELQGIWGSSSSDVWAVGTYLLPPSVYSVRLVLHYDGSAWSEVSVPPMPVHEDDFLYWGMAESIHVWGRSANDVFIAGREQILHFDGKAWSVQLHLPNVKFLRIPGTSGADLFFAGWKKDIGRAFWHYDGLSWSEMGVPGGSDNTSLAGVVGNDAYFSVKNAENWRYHLVRWSGGSWFEMGEWPDEGYVGSFWGTSVNDLFYEPATGPRTTYHYDGTTWSVSNISGEFTTLWGSSARDIFVVGTEGILHFDGADWSVMDAPWKADLFGVWGSSGSDVFAVGSDTASDAPSVILHYDGANWTQMTVPAAVDEGRLVSVWGSAPDDVFAVGSDEVPVWSPPGSNSYCSNVAKVLHYDGTAWSPMTLPPAPFYYLSGIWGTSGSDVFAIGGVCLPWGAAILHYDGNSWTQMTIPPFIETLYDIRGSSSTDVYAVGAYGPHSNGVILHWDGAEWTELDWDAQIPYGLGEGTASARDFTVDGVWGLAADDLYIVSGAGSLVHFDGAAWSWAPMPCLIDGSCATSVGGYYNGSFGGVWGSASENVYAVNSLGDIVHHGVPGPASLSAGDGQAGGIVSLAWGAVPGTAGYQIHRSPAGVFDYRRIASVAGDVLAHDDPVGCGTREYLFRVAAVFPDGSLSAFSPVDAGSTGVCGPPTAPTLISPVGLWSMSTPTYTWNAKPGVTSYRLWVGTGTTTKHTSWYTAEAAGCAAGTGTCSVTPEAPLAGGRWYFNVLGRNAAGTGPWAVSKNFFTGAAPTALTLVSPTGGIGMTAPTYQWTAQPGVDSYLLWVGSGSSTVFSAWYTATAAGCSAGTGICAVTPANVVGQGSWYFNVRGKNVGGTGPWATAKNFVVGTPPTAPTLLSPSGAAGTSTPTFQWTAQPGATSYQIWIGSFSTTIVQPAWFTAAEAGCGAGEATCSWTTAAPLAAGTWFFNVKSRNAAGSSPWATAKSFSTP